VNAPLLERGPQAREPGQWSPPGPRQNLLLASLPPADFDVLAAHMEPVALSARQRLYGPDAPATYAWFPGTAVISLQQVIDGKAGSEVALVGREGMVGLVAVLGDLPNTRQACVHCAGHAWRVPSAMLRQCFDASPELRALLLRHAQGIMAQIAQNGVCYRLHSVEQQVCRRLLMSMDRLGSREIPVTHEALAGALGVRREAVTLAACRLLADGLLQGGRGRMVVLDREGLERRACECYQTLRLETQRLMAVAPAATR
jgi:CRP-like cAMP-binding protein